MLYIMHRTQLYLDEDLWTTLQIRAKKDGTTISELVRQAARERYSDDVEGRRAAVDSFIGIREDRPELEDVDAYIRTLRKGDRRRKMLAE
jgi:hypothetical protein